MMGPGTVPLYGGVRMRLETVALGIMALCGLAVLTWPNIKAWSKRKHERSTWRKAKREVRR